MRKSRIQIKGLVALSLIATVSGAVNGQEQCKKWQSAWSECKSDSECVVVSNPCGWPTASANKASAEEAFKCNRIEGAALACATWDDKKGGKRVAKCERGQCVSRPAQEGK